MFCRRSFWIIQLLLVGIASMSLCWAQEHWQHSAHDRYANEDTSAPDDKHVEQWPHQPQQAPHVYRPVPQMPPPASRDPSAVLVPRLGWVRGNVAYKTIKNRPVSAFLGLKYGTVGKGLARFQPATVYEHNSNDAIDATREPANCPQFPDLQEITARERGGEPVDDCLTLNVYTPNIRGSLPVMVFVHGEMLFDGSAAEGQPDYFLEHDVVVVTINYRLAPFGFLTTLSEEMPGNVALADIKMALEWVQQYIRPFGGNADAVTLFGQAGGATLIHALSLSGRAKGLFHKLILQSGTALNPYFLDEDPLSTIRSFSRFARCPVSSERTLQSVSSCFEHMSTAQLLTVFKRHWDDNEPRGLRFTGGFKLVIGDKLGFLPQPPAALVVNSTYPTIAGVTKDAGAFIMSRFYKQVSQIRSRNISDYINVVLRHTTQPRNFIAWKNLAIEHIFTQEDIKNPTADNLAQGLLELINLILYRGPVIDSIRYTWRKYPTYLYYFGYRGEFHRFGHLDNPLPFEVDATLSDDNIYLFPYPEEVSQLNAEDLTMARALTTMWVNFAQHSVPNFNVGIWPNVSTDHGPFLRFSNTEGNPLELDYHFGEGIMPPNLYPQYFTTTTTTTTRRPRPNYPNYPSYPNDPNYRPNSNNYPSYPNYRPNYPEERPVYQPPPYRAHETVLHDGEISPPEPAHAHQLPHYANYPPHY